MTLTAQISVKATAALLTGCLFCPRCLAFQVATRQPAPHAPMYRIAVGRKPYRREYYRCAGRYPGRNSCGNMVDLAALDELVTGKIGTSDEPHEDLRSVPGENHDIELTEIKLALSDLGNQGLSDAAEDAERARLRAKRDELLKLPNTPDRWEEELTGQTEGDYFASLDPEQQRAYLVARYRIFAGKHDDGEPYALLDIKGPYGLRTMDVAGRLPVRLIYASSSTPDGHHGTHARASV